MLCWSISRRACRTRLQALLLASPQHHACRVLAACTASQCDPLCDSRMAGRSSRTTTARRWRPGHRPGAPSSQPWPAGAGCGAPAARSRRRCRAPATARTQGQDWAQGRPPRCGRAQRRRHAAPGCPRSSHGLLRRRCVICEQDSVHVITESLCPLPLALSAARNCVTRASLSSCYAETLSGHSTETHAQSLPHDIKRVVLILCRLQ